MSQEETVVTLNLSPSFEGFGFLSPGETSLLERASDALSWTMEDD